MKEILFFIFDNMTDYEITFAMHMLNTSGKYKVVTVAYDATDKNSRSGAVYKPHRLVSDVLNKDAAGLVICGGWYGDYRPELNELILHLNESQKLLAGICGAGTFMLAKSGVLSDVKYTTPITTWTEEHETVFCKDDVFNRENYLPVGVVRSGHIITSLGHTFVEFAVEVMDGLEMFEAEKDKQDFLNFMRHVE